MELDTAGLNGVIAPSPHFAGIPELRRVAEHLNLPFPRELRIIAVEVEDAETIREGIGAKVRAALPELTAWIVDLVNAWEKAPQYNNLPY